MTNRQPNLRQTTGEKSRTFLFTGVLAVIVTGIAAPLGLFDWLPIIGKLFTRGGPVSGIAVLVIAFSLWVALFVLVRLVTTNQERRAIRQLRHVMGTRNGLSQYWPPANTLVAHRVAAYRSAPDQATAALAARSELDHAFGEVSYVPVRALVWALPALGFLGTAAEMSRAVGGLRGSVGATADFGDLRNALVSDVIPPLGDAFGATLFALGAGVLCHLLLTWTTAREQRTLLDLEEATLKLVGLPSARPPAVAAPSLNGELDGLTRELVRTRQEMTTSARQLAGLDLAQLAHLGELTDLGQLAHLSELADLAPLLRSLDQRLSQIHAELSRDLVLTRLTPARNQGLAR